MPNIKFDDLEWENFEKHYNFNIKSNLYLIQSLIPYMCQQKYGKIVCISTQYTDEPKPELSYYIAAKSALIGFVKSIATELAPKGIRINIVSPGMTDDRKNGENDESDHRNLILVKRNLQYSSSNFTKRHTTTQTL